MKKTKILLALLLFVFAGAIRAQVTTANMKGLITDTDNEPLAGANVVAVHTPTGTTYGVATNFDGRFNLLNLRVGGPYTVTISYIGFQTREYTDVFLELGKTLTADVALIEDSQQLEEVVITGSRTGVFGSGRTGAETNVGRRELTTLPTITRSAQDFTRMEPSASGGSFGGRNDQYNNFSLDGSIFNNPYGLDAATPGGQTEAQPISLDAIDQIQVATAPYDVTQSGFTGASVNAVTKSGTNEFHGTVYGFYRNQDLTGSKVKGEKIFVPKLTQAQYGASIGGPIVKNKLFFFANFERDQREDLGSSWIANRGTGTINESRVLESDLMAVSNDLAALGYETGSYEGYIHETESVKGIFKLDWNINDKNRLAFIYNFLDASKEKPAHPTAISRRGPDATTLQFRNSGYRINNEIQSFLIELNSNFTDHITNKLQVGYTHFNDFRDPFSTPAPVINITKDGSPYIIAGHEPFSINNRLDQKVFQVTNNLNYFRGDHTYTFGVSFEKFMFKNSFNLTGYGFDIFASVDINDFSAANYQEAFDNAMATFEAKNAAGDGNDGGWNLSEVNVGQLAFYLQDEWNITENFKLTYGVRIDKPLYFNTSDLVQKYIDTDNGQFYNPSTAYFDPDTGEEVFFDSTKMPNDNLLWSPRLGFNWDINSDKSLQLRGGTGVFTGRLPFVWIGNQVSGIDQFFYQIVDPDFKFPQVWRSSLGIDYRFENGLIATADLAYTRDINAVHVQNWGLKTPTVTLNGVDSRMVYGPEDKGEYPGYVLTNSNKGRVFNASLRLQKHFDNGLYTSLAYNYLDSRDVNSIEAEITGDAFTFNPALNNVNNDVLAHSKYGDKHRIVGIASKQWKYGNDKWATTISTFFEYAQGGRFSYTYGGDINNDGSVMNDLIYIPTAAEVNEMQFTGQGQAEALENYIQQDDYLSDRRGQYAERYGAIAPWRGRWDFKFLQDYNIQVSEDKVNTIQFSVDILNLGNLINSDWGLVQEITNTQPIGVRVENNTPVYTFNPDQTRTFVYNSNLDSRWQIQFGLRYSF
ncbi:TonB-dependent receptor [Sinomicrobium weinanense]|uniref:TonB-dependent receptor n=1 Tax=Sinomicrobium weinanense TaxID=2842200 RepID=A0A926JV12_9FLAO|nr:carboxypeptidase regulatory-like domain-containing protein [Sinomicrobium weinanense]MBC9797884.1 TonB-dependent receptor [Sinomicrobium weinanense]MBU3122758.1 carboxypeptidase regulatory-like domain-containing protein [Sinomicrobium weinanense]